MTAPAPDAALALWLGDGPLPRRAERLPTTAAAGRVLVRDVAAARDSPPVTCAAMDGIAVRAADVRAAPVVLPAGAFARVDTGQALPAGHDAVVMREDVTLRADGAVIVARAALGPGQHVRPQGEDITVGDVLVTAGTALGPGALAVLLAGGVAAVDVVAPPRVAVVPTGDEVRPIGAAGPADVIDSNGPMLAALLAAAGCAPVYAPPVPDEPAALEAALLDAAATCDLVCVIAGTSKGTRDRVPDVLRAHGRVDVERLAVRPGSPTLLGHLGATPVACLPGYPVAAWVVAHLDVLPAVERLGALPRPPRVRGVLGAAVDVRPDATTVHPAIAAVDETGVVRVEPLPRRASRLSVLARANALAILPPGTSGAVGAAVLVQMT